MKVSPLDYILSTIIMLPLWIISGIISFKILSPFLFKHIDYYSYIVTSLSFLIFYGLFSAAVLRILLVVKPILTGEFDMDHPNFIYWKLLKMITEFGMKTLFILRFAPFEPILYFLFGCRIGKNVAIGGIIDSPFLVSIGDNSIIGQGSIVSGDYVLNNKLVIGNVNIGQRVTIGVNCLILPNNFIKDGVLVSPGSVLLSHSEVGENETWKGNPARKWL